jgi:cell division protein FtsQ
MGRHLGIDIVQKRPLARVLHNDGVSYYIDEEGEFLPVSDNFTARVPVISGALPPLHEGQAVSDHPSWNALFSLMQSIQYDRFSRSLIEEIHVESSGELLLVPKLGDLVIRFGQIENATSKLAKLRAFYRGSVTDINLNKFESIDLRFQGQVVCKKRAS